MSVKVNYNNQSQVKNAVNTAFIFLNKLNFSGYLYLFDVVHVNYFVYADKKTYEQRLALWLFYKPVQLQPQ